MRTFYIFKIKNEYYKLTKNNPFNLYLAYLNIKMSTKENIKYLYNEYNSFTSTINKVKLSTYLYDKFKDLDGYSIYNDIHMFNNYYTSESSKLIIFNSFMILKTNQSISSFFYELNKIPNLFVIDFDTEDYFFIQDLELNKQKSKAA